ncbi:MAG: hypothetical protein IJ859_13425 [Synergistaceae bacterium]|nr:hypothetical protein [Synergistaceae bacterium]
MTTETKYDLYKSRRKKIDWDAELEKTEKIKRRGFFMSGLSFALACVLIFGMSRATDANIEIPRSVLTAICFFVSCVVLGVIMRRRAKKKNEAQNKENE